MVYNCAVLGADTILSVLMERLSDAFGGKLATRAEETKLGVKRALAAGRLLYPLFQASPRQDRDG